MGQAQQVQTAANPQELATCFWRTVKWTSLTLRVSSEVRTDSHDWVNRLVLL